MRITDNTSKSLIKMTLETLKSNKCKGKNEDSMLLEKYKRALDDFKNGRRKSVKFNHPLSKEDEKELEEIRYHYGLHLYQFMIYLIGEQLQAKEYLSRRLNFIIKMFDVGLGKKTIESNINDEDLKQVLNMIVIEELALLRANKNVLVELSEYASYYTKYRDFLIKHYDIDIRTNKVTEKEVNAILEEHKLFNPTPFEEEKVVSYIKEYCNKRIMSDVIIGSKTAPIDIINIKNELTVSDIFLIKQFVYYLSSDLKLDIRTRLEKLSGFEFEFDLLEEEDIKLIAFYDSGTIIDGFSIKKKTK